ncbi:hypothetical protein PR048_017080 [Dryococelus australis]|uniref:Uncharacterized protein n=1 Tax=Dryococelus australis TaxID=614101 RepID=A0ABQ9H8J9_9NEOP|nr:hypothetical protein PR048_017080 [Dryococelus australis]
MAVCNCRVCHGRYMASATDDERFSAGRGLSVFTTTVVDNVGHSLRIDVLAVGLLLLPSMNIYPMVDFMISCITTRYRNRTSRVVQGEVVMGMQYLVGIYHARNGGTIIAVSAYSGVTSTTRCTRGLRVFTATPVKAVAPRGQERQRRVRTEIHAGRHMSIRPFSSSEVGCSVTRDPIFRDALIPNATVGAGRQNGRHSQLVGNCPPYSYFGSRDDELLHCGDVASSQVAPQRFDEASMEQRRNERAGETGDLRENPPTSGIVRHDSHMRKSGSDPAGNRTRFVYVGEVAGTLGALYSSRNILRNDFVARLCQRTPARGSTCVKSTQTAAAGERLARRDIDPGARLTAARVSYAAQERLFKSVVAGEEASLAPLINRRLARPGWAPTAHGGQITREARGRGLPRSCSPLPGSLSPPSRDVAGPPPGSLLWEQRALRRQIRAITAVAPPLDMHPRESASSATSLLAVLQLLHNLAHYTTFKVTSNLSEEQLKFYFQDIPPPHINKAWKITLGGQCTAFVRIQYDIRSNPHCGSNSSCTDVEINNVAPIPLVPPAVRQWYSYALILSLRGLPPGAKQEFQSSTFINFRIPSAPVSLLASHQGEPGHSGFSHVGIVPDDADGRRVFSGISRFTRPFIPALLHTHLISPSLTLKISWFRAAQISSLILTKDPTKCDSVYPDREDSAYELQRYTPPDEISWLVAFATLHSRAAHERKEMKISHMFAKSLLFASPRLIERPELRGADHLSSDATIDNGEENTCAMPEAHSPCQHATASTTRHLKLNKQ